MVPGERVCERRLAEEVGGDDRAGLEPTLVDDVEALAALLGESCAGLGKTRAKTPKVIRRARVRTRLRVVSAPTSRGAGADGEPAELVAVHVV